MNNPKFQIFRDIRSEYRYRLKAKNGEIILRSSKGYVTKDACRTDIVSVKVNSTDDNRYHRQISTNGQYYFTLNDLNNNVIGVSETYQTKIGRENGISAVKRDAPTAPTEDLTLSQRNYFIY